MSIDSYVGIDAPCINVENAGELYDAIDLLHTQVMDNLSNNPMYDALLKILSDAMDRIQAEIDMQ